MVRPLTGHNGRLVLMLFLILWGGDLFAQRPITSREYNPLGITSNDDIEYGNIPSVIDNNAPPEDTTSVKPPRVRKPLESYFFGDSLRVRPNFVWTADFDRNRVNEVHIDTMQTGFQVDYPYFKDSPTASYLGNLGAVTIPDNYFARPDYRQNSFASAFDAYLMTPERVKFFNVKKPFTHLSYFIMGQTKKLEEDLWVTHAQNVSPSTGFNIDYKSRGTKGYYSRQKARDKNLSAAFSHTGKRYTVHAGYIYNMADVRENGGIRNDWDVTDTVYELPELVPVKLQEAKNLFKNNVYYVIQSYGIPLIKVAEDDFSIADRSSIFIGHSFRYSRFSKRYTDTRNNGNDYPDPYYDNWYVDAAASNDSIFESTISNRIFVQIQPWDRNGVLGVIDAGVGNDLHHYYQFGMSDYLKAKNGVNKSSTFLYGSVEGRFREYLSWDAAIRYHPFGYRSQDLYFGGNLTLSAKIKGHPVTLKGNISSDFRSPDYWTENYFSNHFMWQNSFSKEKEVRIGAALDVPHWGLELGANQSVITDKIYYNALMMPSQHSGSVSVSGLYAKKDFRLGGFHLNNRVLLQWSSVQEVIPVPLASIYLSWFFEFNVVRDVLRLQLGVDGRYNTEYYAFGYNPATAQFYNQREKKLGNYPMLDFFVTAKWKRMRILIKLQHMNENLFGDRNYFTVLHYPQNKRMLKFGFSWTFYD